jgi:hypothetical protein
VLKVTGKGQGVDDLRKMLATRFARGSRAFAARHPSRACGGPKNGTEVVKNGSDSLTIRLNYCGASEPVM